MGILDWIGPTSLTKRRGWGALPPAPAPVPERRSLDIPAFGQPVSIGPGMLFMPTTSARSTPPEHNSAVAACLAVLAESVVEPDLLVYRVAGAERVVVPSSPLGALMARPNPWLSLKSLTSYATLCLHVAGNAYWRKLRSGDPLAGNVVELWPIAPGRIEPYTRPGSDDFISHYRYSDADGRVTELAPDNVVHFRYGIDDADHRLGLAPLSRLLREISSDQQATRYADRLLANLAINGLTLSFDKDSPSIDQATADELKARIQSAYGGDRAGSAAVLSPGATLTSLGFSPEQMDMRTLHRVPEERISAVLGVPAIVAGLGAGLDRSTFSNFKEAREAFTELKMLPLWTSLADTLTMSLVPDFDRSGSIVLDFDLSQVRALSDDQDALAVRMTSLVAAGILSVDEARAAFGLGPAEVAPATAVPAETRSRPYVLRGPAPETKAAEDLLGDYDELAERRLPTWEAEVLAFFRAQSRRVEQRLRDGAATAGGLVPDGEVLLLEQTLAPLQLALLDELVPLVIAELGIAFQVDDPATREYLRRCAHSVVGITDTTRGQIRAALAEGQAAGEGIPELARRLRGLPAFDAARARVVARTELGRATMESSLASYQASGVVVGVRVADGDEDAPCAARNGRTLTLDQAAAAPALLHPNCTAAYLPLTDVADLTRSA
jgi:HK97 family phage portal protein